MDLAATARGRTARVRTLALRVSIGLSVGAVLIAAFLRLVNAGAVYQRLTHLNLGIGLLCGVTFLAAYVIRAMRWRCLLTPSQVSVRRAAAIYQIAIFLNWLLPVRGGEIAMSLLLRRSNGIPVNESLAAVSMDKSMDLLPAAALLLLMPFAGLRLSRPLWLVLVGAVAAVCLGVGFLAMAAWWRDRAVALLAWPLETFLRGSVRAHVRPFISGFIDTLMSLIRRPRILFIAAMYTVLALGVDALFCLLAFRAVGVTVPLLVVLCGYTLYNLSFVLPSLPGQVGSNELIGLLIFSGIFRVSRAGVGAMFLFSHPWTGILMTCAGLACLSGMSLTLRSTLQLAQSHEDWKDDDGPRNRSGGLPRQPRHCPAYHARHAAARAYSPKHRRELADAGRR
ncbi:MAG: flippase-like domain-containing protein [Streptosporangiaceae bacterium]|nr:flippase-like domain-containing protein [Streptosporangiaceae bacterium]